jgi:hypothetical protein
MTQNNTTLERLPDSSAGPSPEHIQAALERILASEEFAGSAQLSRFLRHIVGDGPGADARLLKESVIGVAVFNRGPAYDPKVDPIVRVEARRLRARLDAYYQKHADEDVRISLPKGAYLPSFEFTPAPFTREEVVVAETPPFHPTANPGTRWRFRVMAAFAVALVALAVALVYRSRTPERLVTTFWSSILDAERPVLVIPADSALVMLQDLARQPVQLPEYITGEYRARLSAASRLDPKTVFDLAGRRYTSIADLEFASRLSHRPEASRLGLRTRYARDVRVEDLKGGNMVFLGARHSNPWIELFEKDATFRLQHDESTGAFTVVNTRPERGEQAAIIISPANLQHDIYGIITYHRNREGAGKVLVVAGTSVAGTEAAADFLLDDARLLSWLRRASPSGEIRGFDLLLHDRNLSGSAQRAEVVAFHVER